MYAKRITILALSLLVLVSVTGCATFRDDFDLEQVKPLAVSASARTALQSRAGLEVCIEEVRFYDSRPMHKIIKEKKIREGAFHFRDFPPQLHPDQKTLDIYKRFSGGLPTLLAGIGFKILSACREGITRVGVDFSLLFKEEKPQLMMMWSGLNFIYRDEMVIMTGIGWQGALNQHTIEANGIALLIDYSSQKHLKEIAVLWPKTFGPPPDPGTPKK